jgi:hypothetical protein
MQHLTLIVTADVQPQSGGEWVTICPAWLLSPINRPGDPDRIHIGAEP